MRVYLEFKENRPRDGPQMMRMLKERAFRNKMESMYINTENRDSEFELRKEDIQLNQLSAK